MSAAAPDAGAEPARRRGRRPAGEDTRAAILAAARSEFAARGYEGTTLRGVARVAGVDPRLVHHYFEGKDDLFTAAMELPFRPQDVVRRALEGTTEGNLGNVGERLLRTFLGVWDSTDGRERVVALLSSVLTSESAARTVREFLAREVFGRLVAVTGGEDRELRASLAASQMIGLIMARYVVKIEPLASADPESFIPYLAPTLQRYLAGEAG